MSSMALDPAAAVSQDPAQAVAQTTLPQSMWLTRNPQLPQSPLGAYQDSQYAAQDAILRNNVAKQYADILQQLGYVDPTSGQFIMGSVEANANRQQADLQRQMQLADEQVTNQHQQLGTLFSGLRGTDQARAEYPMVSAISQLQTQTPLTLQQLYEQAAGLTTDYTLQQNSNIADAASRRAASLQANPPAGDATATTPNSAATSGDSGPYIGTLPGGNAIKPGIQLADPTVGGILPVAGSPNNGPYIGTLPAALQGTGNARKPGIQM